MMKILTYFLGGMLPVIASAHIHKVKMNQDQILLVKTALGIATIIETPESIQSAIIGDQSGFKIEYLDHAVTIKPLRYGARTNLYLQTTVRRYDLRLETGKQDAADYIVYLKTSDGHGPLIWKDVLKTTSGKYQTLKALRVAKLQGAFLLDLKLSSKTKAKLRPENFWIFQGKESKAIDNLFLAKLEVKSDHPVMIGLKLLTSDLVKERSIEISFKGEDEALSLTLPPDILWK